MRGGGGPASSPRGDGSSSRMASVKASSTDGANSRVCGGRKSRRRYCERRLSQCCRTTFSFIESETLFRNLKSFFLPRDWARNAAPRKGTYCRVPHGLLLRGSGWLSAGRVSNRRAWSVRASGSGFTDGPDWLVPRGPKRHIGGQKKVT